MLPLSHTYINYKLTGSKDPLLILGGVLPDISTASGERLSRDLLHNNPIRFYEFVAQKYPRLLPMALGVVFHSQVNHGADFYSDNHETGFAYKAGLPLAPRVAELLGRKTDQACAVLAHNFIEAGIDLNLSQNQPETFALYQNSIKAVDQSLAVLCLADYFSVSASLARQSLEKLLEFLAPDNFTSVEKMVAGAIVPLIKIRLQQDVSAPAAGALVKQGVALTAPTYLEFLDRTVASMRRDFAKYLPSITETNDQRFSHKT